MGTVYEIDMADMCELAHELTLEECDRLGIEVDMKVDENGDETERYTEKAQDIFNRYFDLVEMTLVGDNGNNLVCKKVRLSVEAYEKIIELLEDELSLQNGHEDRQEEIGTIIDEVKTIGFFAQRYE